MVITSKANPLVKKIKSLSEKKYRREYGLYVVEGRKPVREAVEAELEIDTIVATEDLAGAYENMTIVSDIVFAYLSEEKTPQGILAVVKIPKVTLKEPQKSCLLLDGIQDPGNLGTIIRTANAAGFKELYLIDCADPYSQKVVRSSMSGIFFETIYSGGRAEVLSALAGTPLIIADMHGENIFKFYPPKKYCLCIGNEGNGVSPEVKAEAVCKIAIPMQNTCESLNAGVSAGIAMYVLKNKEIEV